MESPDKQHQYFTLAYQTGSDIWSHIPYRFKAEEILPKLKTNSMILDVGAGRGLWAMNLLRHGYRVLGIDYVQSIVDSVNKRISDEGYENQARFMLGDTLNIPFAENSFDAVTDIGTFQHIKHNDWQTYVNEIHSVLKHGGYYLNISLSRRTHSFLGFKPSKSETGDFKKFDVNYHFFTEHEVHNIFNKHFTIVEQQHEEYKSASDPMDNVTLIFTLMQKN